jgi:hypothetical protein
LLEELPQPEELLPRSGIARDEKQLAGVAMSTSLAINSRELVWVDLVLDLFREELESGDALYRSHEIVYLACYLEYENAIRLEGVGIVPCAQPLSVEGIR